MKSNKKRGLIGTVGALAAATALALSGTVAASAAPTIPPTDATGSLNITKLVQPDTLGAAANGVEKNVSGLTPIEGVTFKVEKVNQDLSTNAGWIAAAALAESWGGNIGALGALTEVGTGVTDEDGRVKFGVNANSGWDDVENSLTGTLPVGLYLVTETGYSPTTGGPGSVVFGAPFLVTVPLTHPTALDTWMYDVYVYPKNSTGSKKTVAENGVVPGSAVTWSIFGDIPRGDVLTKYIVTDELDPRLSLTDSDDLAESIKVSLVDSDGDALTDPTLTGENPNPDYTLALSSGTVTVTFTEVGRTKLLAAGAAVGNQVKVTIDSVVNSLIDGGVAGEGEISNSANFNFNNGTEHNVGTNDVETKWGGISFTKVASDKEEEAELAEVEFQIFTSAEDAASQMNPIAAYSTTGKDSADSEGRYTTFVTGNDGKIVVSGLRYSGFVNGAEVDNTDLDYQYYWLVETKAADGYSLLAEPLKFEVNSAGNLVLAGDEEVTDEIVNVPHNGGFELPLTGGTGTLLLTILGVGILATVLVVARRRQNAAAAE